MLCIWCQFQGFYNIRTPKHNFDQCKPKHDYDPRGLIFIVVKFFLFSGLRGTDMLCMSRQFRGFYRCMVTVVVSMHTPKHSSDPCGSIFIFV